MKLSYDPATDSLYIHLSERASVDSNEVSDGVVLDYAADRLCDTILLMRPSEALNLHRARIREIALSHRVRDVRVFGSAMRGDDVQGSDLDLLVEPTAQTTLFDIGAIRFELKQLLGMDIDVLTPNALPEKFRARVLKDAQPV